jgi:hypothetical protein
VLRLLAVAKDNAGYVSTARATTTVVAAQGGGRRDGDHPLPPSGGRLRGLGPAPVGRAIASDVGTTWDAPRAPTRTDGFGDVFEIPLADGPRR